MSSSETPLVTSSSHAYSEESFPSTRILGTNEFWYYASKTKLSIDRLNKTLDKAVLLFKLGDSVTELKAEMKKFSADIDRWAETMNSSSEEPNSSSNSNLNLNESQ